LSKMFLDVFGIEINIEKIFPFIKHVDMAGG
jgi:hypothetical protein